MKLATDNVNGINGRLDVMLRGLKEAQPDVVCLQELKAPDEKFPRREIERAGYGAIWHGQRIALVETAIEDRFPSQLLAPYKDWRQRRTTD